MPFFQDLIPSKSKSSSNPKIVAPPKRNNKNKGSKINSSPSSIMTIDDADDIVEINSDDSDVILSSSTRNQQKRRLKNHNSNKSSSIVVIDDNMAALLSKNSLKRERNDGGNSDVMFVSSKKVSPQEEQLSEPSTSCVVNSKDSQKNSGNVTINDNNIGNTNSNSNLPASVVNNLMPKLKIEEKSVTVTVQQTSLPQQQQPQNTTSTAGESINNSTEKRSATVTNSQPVQQTTVSGNKQPSAIVQNTTPISVSNPPQQALKSQHVPSNPVNSSTVTSTNTPSSNNTQNRPVNTMTVEQLTQQVLASIENLKRKNDFSSVTCPITRKIICHPVLASDGIMYDKPFIVSYIQTHGSFSPLVKGCKITESSLINVENVYTKAVLLIEEKLNKIIELFHTTDFARISPLIPENYLDLINFATEIIAEGKLNTQSTPKTVEILRKEKSKLLFLYRKKLKQKGTPEKILNTHVESYELYKIGFNCEDIESVISSLLKADGQSITNEKRVELIKDLFGLSNQSLPRMVSNFNVETDFGIVFELFATLLQKNLCKFDSISTFILQTITELNKGEVNDAFFKQIVFLRNQLVLCRRDLE